MIISEGMHEQSAIEEENAANWNTSNRIEKYVAENWDTFNQVRKCVKKILNSEP